MKVCGADAKGSNLSILFPLIRERESSLAPRDVPVRKDNRIWLLGGEIDWSEPRGKRVEHGQAAEHDSVEAEDEALGDPGDSGGVIVDVRSPPDGIRGDMEAEGLERMALLLHPIGVAASGETSLYSRRENRSATQKCVLSAHHELFICCLLCN